MGVLIYAVSLGKLFSPYRFRQIQKDETTMDEAAIVCIDDQRPVLASLERDLELLGPYFTFDFCESASEAEEVIENLYGKDIPVALIICDHIMPEKKGIEFLSEMREDSRVENARKILLTGLADQKDTILAINQGGVNFYIEKPWEKEHLIKTVQIQLTHFLVGAGFEYTQFMPAVDQETLYKLLQSST
ncbi:MAG: response regulator [Nitrospinota bacterium]